MEWSWEKFSHYLQVVMTVLLCAATIFLLVQTIILTQWTVRSSRVSDQIAADTQASYQALIKVETGISNLVTGLTGIDSPLTKQLAEIKGDTAATKDALDEVKGDITDIKESVETIQEQVDEIKSLLTPPSD
jgi:peptidoglycan hydrolase CwlO-like protein